MSFHVAKIAEHIDPLTPPAGQRVRVDNIRSFAVPAHSGGGHTLYARIAEPMCAPQRPPDVVFTFYGPGADLDAIQRAISSANADAVTHLALLDGDSNRVRHLLEWGQEHGHSGVRAAIEKAPLLPAFKTEVH